jgi:hypothetical protein
MEGQRFACSWKKSGKLYHVWVKKRPKLSATGKTFQEADRRLWAVILEATGDGESIRSYDPPEPGAEELVEVQPLDTSTWLAQLRQHVHVEAKRETLDTNAKIQRKFAQRVEEHFSFLPDLGFKGPELSREFDALTGMNFRARFASAKRAVNIDLSKAQKEYPSGTSFCIDPVPVRDQFESFMGTMYLPVRHRELAHLLAEFEAAHTLDQIMQLAFPLYADLFRTELQPLLRARQWHDEYAFYRE